MTIKLHDGLSPIREVAADYIARGWQPVPLFPRDKKPRGGKGWQVKVWVPDNFRDNDNIGAMLGNPSGGLTDLDFDIAEARRLAPDIFPELPFFGRAGAPGGHRLVICPDGPGKIVKFQLPPEPAKRLLGLEPDTSDKAVILEIRCKGQTMFPPSIHPSGQRVEWDAGAPPDDIPEMAYADILLRARILALCAVVLRAYPDGQSCRNDICLALSGTLVRMGLEDSEVDRIVVAVARAAKDEEADERGGNAADERAKLEQRGEFTGLPRLLELLGLNELEPSIRKWLNLTDEAGPLPPDAIVMREGDLPQIVDKAEDALLRHGSPIYQRGGELIRTVRIDSSATDDDGVRRAEGSTVLKPVTAPWLVEQMARAAPWYRLRGKRAMPADPDWKYAKTLLARAGEWRFPPLRGVIRTPTITPAGRLIETPGYDPETRLLLDFEAGEFPPVPQFPSKAEATEELKRLVRPLRGYEFADDAAESVAVAAMLTTVVRPGLSTAPGIAIDSPVAGAGKTMQIGMLGVLMTGRQPPAITQGRTEEETEKRLSAALRAGDPILMMDNCTRSIEGDFLCSLLTSEEVAPRILGMSENMRLPSNVLFCATGNNLVIAGDATQRFLSCRIDAKVERPDLRKFDFDPIEEVKRDRAELVKSALTVLRAYIVAGRPKPLDAFRLYFEWAVIREALVWLGYTDPIGTRNALIADDPKRHELSEFMALWGDVVGEDSITVAELHARLNGTGEKNEALRTNLEAGCPRGRWNSNSIGWRLRGYKDQLTGGCCFKADGSDPIRWKLEGWEAKMKAAAAKTGNGAAAVPGAAAAVGETGSPSGQQAGDTSPPSKQGDSPPPGEERKY